MQSIHSTVNVATLETNIGLHDSWTLGTFHMLWDLSSSNGGIPYHENKIKQLNICIQHKKKKPNTTTLTTINKINIAYENYKFKKF